jgi:O-antigen/teichoic acid export membrane protein
MRKVASGVPAPHSQASTGQTENAAQELVRRAPSGYLWNQIFSIWLYVSLLLYELVVRRSLPLTETGVWDLASTAANLGVYIASLGLTSAGAVFLPRALAEGGPGQAMAVALRLVLTRLAAVAVVALAILWGLPALAALLAHTGVSSIISLSHSLNDPRLLAHRVAIAGMVVGTGMANLLAALLTSLLRTRSVFVVGGLAQLLVVVLAYVFIKPLGGGADAALSALVLPAAVSAVVYAVIIRRVLAGPAAVGYPHLMAPMLRLGLASWLADLANAAFFKPLALFQLAAYLGSVAQVPFFSSVFQLGHGAALVVLTGVSGVSIAILSAAYASRHRGELVTAWRAISKMQVLLTIPLMAFFIPHGLAIIRVFGQDYSSAGGLLAMFLALNVLVQLCGATAHEAALYVLGRQNWVVISRWGSLGLLALGDVVLIPRYGVGGALASVALAQLAAAAFLLALAMRAVQGPYPVGFILKILAALVLPFAFSALWRPSSLVSLVFAGLGYAAIFLVCLRLIRPLDAEDGVLLTQVATPLRVILQPFVAPARPGVGTASSPGAMAPGGQRGPSPTALPTSGPPRQPSTTHPPAR